MELIYLDHNATTPVDPEVVEAMLPYLLGDFGNASSVHTYGRDAKVALEKAREQIASVINCDPSELYFTSGGTESDNISILGTAARFRGKKQHIVVGAAEHHAVIEPAEYLAHKEGFKLDLLGVDKEGFSSADELKKLVTDKTALISVMHANNETGTVQDIAALAAAAHEKDALFHTDAAGKLVTRDGSLAHIQGVHESDLERIQVQAPSEHVHLGFGGEGGLGAAIAAHGSAGRVVSVDGV